MQCVLAWYNIGWHKSRFNHAKKHEADLREDLRDTIENRVAYVIMPSECGGIGEGLPKDKWLPMLGRIAPGFSVTHQSHYATLVRESSVDVHEGPRLLGPLTSQRGTNTRCVSICE